MGKSDITRPRNIPEQIGRFKILTALGAGTSGTVYRAHDPHLARDVALKVAHPAGLETPTQVERFLREARAAGALRHPHIVPIYDAGCIEETYYLAAEFIDGRTLADAFAQRRLSLLDKVRVLRQVAEALAYAHRKGVIHRDVKPANILLDGKNKSYLADFGIARHYQHERLTQSGEILGTPAYMAPEQVRQSGTEPGHLADQYSVGVMLYESLCGCCPFEGDAGGVLYQVIHVEPKRPLRVNPEVPRDLESICRKAMAKRPEDRYAGCRALADDLRRWMDGEPVQARPLGWLERGRRWLWREPIVAGTTIVALFALFAAMLVPVVSAMRLNAAVKSQRVAAEELDKAARQAQKNAQEAIAQQERARAAQTRAQEAVAALQGEAARAYQSSQQAVKKADDARQARIDADARKSEVVPWEYAAALVRASKLLREGKRPEALKALQLYETDDEHKAIRGLEWWVLRDIIQSGPDVAMIRGAGRLSGLTALTPTAKEWRFSTDRGELTIPHAGAASFVADPSKRERLGQLLPLTSPNGQVGVYVYEKDRLRINWFQPGKTDHLLEGFGRLPSQLMFSEDSKRLLACFSVPLDGETLVLWDVGKGKLLQKYLPGTTSELRLKMSRDGRTVAAILKDSRVCQLWSDRSPEKAQVLRHETAILDFGFSPDGTLFRTHTQSELTIWEVEGRKRLQIDLGKLGSAVVSPDWTRAAATDGAQTALWDLATAKERHKLAGTPAYPVLTFSDDGTVLFVSEEARKGMVQAWDVRSGVKKVQVPREQAEEWYTGGRGDGVLLIALPRTGDQFRVWNVTSGEVRGPAPLEQKRPVHVSCCPGGECILFLFEDGMAQIQRRSLMRPILGDEGRAVASLSLCFDGNTALLAVGDVIQRWDIKSGVKKGSQAFDAMTRFVACSLSDKPYTAMLDAGGVLRVRQTDSARVQQLWQRRIGAPSCLVFSGDGKSLIIGQADGSVGIHEATTGRVWFTLPATGTNCVAAALSPDGKRLAIARPAGIDLIDIESKKETSLPVTNARCLAWGPQGTTLISGSDDGRVRFWQTLTRQEVLTLDSRVGAVTSLALDRAGVVLAAGSATGRVRLWHAPR